MDCQPCGLVKMQGVVWLVVMVICVKVEDIACRRYGRRTWLLQTQPCRRYRRIDRSRYADNS
jgi:hypothetical protein